MNRDLELIRTMASKLRQEAPQLESHAAKWSQSLEMKPQIERFQLETARAGDTEQPFDDQLALETIVVRTGRPVLLVKDNAPVLAGPELDIWRPLLSESAVQQALKAVIPCVGRIEVEGHPFAEWLGTGWLIEGDMIITNRHVAQEFAVQNGSRFVFRKGIASAMAARIDFNEELEAATANEFKIEDILHIEPDGSHDVAILKVKPTAADGSRLKNFLRLATDRTNPSNVATIGYPASDSRVPDQDLVRRLFGDVYDVKRFAPGKIISNRDGLVMHDCSTLGGNSGSPIIDLADGRVVGLHFSGLFLRENRGVAAREVQAIVDRLRPSPAAGRPGPARESSDGQQQPKVEPPPTPPQAPPQPQPAPPVSSSITSHVARFEITIPIEVTVSVGVPQTGPAQPVPAQPNPVQSGPVQPSPPKQPDDRDPLTRVRERLLEKPGVLDVRKGYVFHDGWVTDQPAIVVAVEDHLVASVRDSIGQSELGQPIEVRSAGPSDYLEKAGLPVTLEGVPATTYQPPADVKLDLVEGPMKAICHLSPDGGWPQIRNFLAKTSRTLTIGMYDLTAPHVLDSIASAVEKNPRKLALVLDPGESIGGSGVKKDDIPEEQTVTGLAANLRNRFRFAWASVGSGRQFASAYHIKVMVRDRKSFWHSSGNLQTSNQPEHEQADASTGWPLLLNHNREWNVVIDNPDLAGIFEDFLEYDLNNATTDERAEAAPLPQLEFDVFDAEAALEAPRGEPQYFPPLVVDRVVKVQPLLTPDNYAPEVLKLIKSAKKEILFQNQSFSILDEDKNDPRYAKLFQALLKKQQSGVDVRIIVRGEFDAKKTVERLKGAGFDTDRIRLQDRCHTKGIIVDGETVLLGSHNWTNQGTLVNRDASLIFFDKEIAEYFAKVFEFDWERLARKSVASERRVRRADGNESVQGATRLNWRDIFTL